MNDSTPSRSRPGRIRPDRSAPGTPSKARKGINSVEIGIRVLDAMARGKGPMALKDISRATELSPSQTHRYLSSLMRQKMVDQNPQTGHYDLGRAAVRIGLAALNRLEPVRVAEEALDRLSALIPETSMVAIWAESGPVAVRWKRGSRLLFASVGLGTTFPLLNSTTGRLFLAFMPTAATAPLLQTELARSRPIGRAKAPTDLDAMLAEIREKGFVEAQGHLAPGIWAASAPVFDPQGALVAGLTIVGAMDDPKKQRRESVDALIQSAKDASERLGASTNRRD